ncbi:MAG: hypothetical protein L6V93_08065 [Clostridiales bacterium]|nr:MAG: hypothetical protein L6V93_08065 [Clostridiales bacterium]
MDYYERAASTMQKGTQQRAQKDNRRVVRLTVLFFKQFFERSCTFVNAYSMLDCAVEAFVKCAFGEEKFNDFFRLRNFKNLYENLPILHKTGDFFVIPTFLYAFS